MKANAVASPIGSTEHHRRLFFQLQNLESYPEAFELAHNELVAMLSYGLSVAHDRSHCDNGNSILDVETYSAEGMDIFLRDTLENTLSAWTKYLRRREQGHGPELFATVEAANAWLVQQAPLKFVDGAWLGHVHKVTTPFALRKVTKQAWQILSEELGDGDPDKHHVNLYRKLLQSIGCVLPHGHTLDFIHCPELAQQENSGIWAAAVGQLAISLFPNEFLPEILGFNLHFETVSFETMQVAHEIKAFGIDPYYFLIHLTIDNADSGHTALAAEAVKDHIELVKETGTKDAAQQSWRRVQAGYLLSQTLSDHSCLRNVENGFSSPNFLLGELSTHVMSIFRSKALVSHRMHTQSRARIGPYSLEEWLESAASDTSTDLNLLTALSQAKPWVHAGASSKSLLVREMMWGGRMFGAFTKHEVTLICRWIDGLTPERNASLYWKFSQRQPIGSEYANEKFQSLTFHHPFSFSDDDTNLDLSRYMELATEIRQGIDNIHEYEYGEQPELQILSHARLPDIIAVWFAHISLLENTINIPSRTTDMIHLNILRLLRAQSGFGIEEDVVAGMDEARRETSTSLVDIGLELTKKLSSTAISAPPHTLQHVFLLAASHGQLEDSFWFANDMLRWRARPTANLGLLLGVASALLDLKRAVARAPNLLERRSRFEFEAIIERENHNLEECTMELQGKNETIYRDLVRGKYMAKSMLSRCI